MKTLKLTFGALMLGSIFFLACNKEEAETVDQKNENTVDAQFTPAEDPYAEREMLELAQILDGNVETNVVVTPRRAAALPCEECCLNKVLEKVTAPWNPALINLHLEYDVSDPAQVVQIKHWVNTGSGYSYFGQDNITTSYDCCTEKSINMSTGHIPSGSIISWSRISNASTGSFCGGSQIEMWTK